MGSALNLSISPLRLVRVGVLGVSSERVVRSADDTAQELFGAGEALLGRPLEYCFQPVAEEDVKAVIGQWPITYLGVAPPTSARCLVHVAHLPGSGDDTGIATVVSVNEYLAESQALARVQLRNTIESIIAGFAHEVRNPLAAILSLTEAALQQDPSPDTVLVRIPGLVGRVESLIRQSLAYSRPKSPNRALHHPSFLLEHAASLLRRRESAAALTFEECDDIPPVMVDLPQVEQILVNLLENALDAARSQVEVRVRGGKTSVPSVCIEVHDDGPGIAADVAPRIFDPFFTTKAHGTGLGLAIARDLTRINGGELHHVPTPRKGATFRLYLPSTPARVLGF